MPWAMASTYGPSPFHCHPYPVLICGRKNFPPAWIGRYGTNSYYLPSAPATAPCDNLSGPGSAPHTCPLAGVISMFCPQPCIFRPLMRPSWYMSKGLSSPPVIQLLHTTSPTCPSLSRHPPTLLPSSLPPLLGYCPPDTLLALLPLQHLLPGQLSSRSWRFHLAYCTTQPAISPRVAPGLHSDGVPPSSLRWELSTPLLPLYGGFGMADGQLPESLFPMLQCLQGCWPPGLD